MKAEPHRIDAFELWCWIKLFGQQVCACVTSLSHVQLFVTPWTVAQQAPLSVGFSRQEYQSGLPFPSPINPKGNQP